MNQEFFDRIEKIIENALIQEVLTTPKPGLVDLHDNGAHTDMNPDLFIRSAKTIAPYLREMCEIGYKKEETPKQIFRWIQKIGVQAEKAMFEETDGVNTHKGAIYNLGILSAAAGICYRQKHQFILADILELSREMTEKSIQEFFKELDRREPRTHGEYLYKTYGEKGIRAQVEAGFPVISEHSYPAMCKCIEQGMEQNAMQVHVLLEIISVLSDTNVLSRSHGDYSAAEWMKQEAGAVLSDGGMLTEKGRNHLEKWNEECIERNLSPGGAADILAATIFLFQLVNEVRL